MIEWNESPETRKEVEERVDVPWFSPSLKLPAGRYQVARAVFITKSESWILETSRFKLSVKTVECEFWLLIDNTISGHEALFVSVKDNTYGLLSAANNTPWELSVYERCEMYSTSMDYGNFLDEPDLANGGVKGNLPLRRKTGQSYNAAPF